MSTVNKTSRINVQTLKQMKADGQKIACLTAYDASFAKVLDNNGVDVVLVGDSLGMVIQGHATTLPVTMEDMIYHGQAVAKGLQHAFLILDMPFMSDASVQQAVANAGRFMQQAGANMVKLEGGADQQELVKRLSLLGIPVCAHIGLQPQRVHKLGGYRVQGRGQDAAERMLSDARVLEQAGADMLLVECVPSELAKRITQAATIPVIGIGAGTDCDGQILVLYDMLGISTGKVPRFAKNYLLEADDIAGAVRQYVDETRSGLFPAAEHSFE
jgi:3-methyl-2-oxobutanoate hydroxymethyltransferase